MKAAIIARAAPLVVLLAAALGAFHRVIGAERGLYFRDHSLVFRPLWWSVWFQLRSGHWPVLNLEHPSGMPLEMSTNAALYTPATLVLLPFDFDTGYDLMIAFHFVVLALGAYLFARALSASKEASLIAALIAALSGPVFSFENLVIGLIGIAYTPWFGWALVRLCYRISLARIALLALALALQLQGMMPELVLADLVLAAAILLRFRPDLRARLFLAMAGAALLSLVLAAADLGPFFEGLRGSRRADGFAYDELSGWVLHPLMSIELIAPAFWAPPDLVFFNVPSVTGSSVDPPYLMTLYLGAALPLALAAPWSDRRARWIAAFALLFLLVAAGTPLHRWLTSLPLLRSGRYAIKYLLFGSAGVAVLAALAVESAALRAKRIAIAAIAVASLGGSLMIASAMPEVHRALGRSASPFESVVPFQLFADTDVVELALAEMRSRLWHGIAACVALAAVAVWGSRNPARQDKLQKLIVLIVAIDLAAAAARALPSATVADVHLPQEVRSRIGARDHRVVTPDPPAVPLLGRPPFEAYLAHRARYGRDVVGEIRRFESLDVDAQARTVFDEILPAMSHASWERNRAILARAGVRYYLASQPPRDPVAMTYPDLEGKPVHAAEIEDSLPYVHTATSWIYAQRGSELLNLLSDPDHLSSAILLDPPEDLGSQTATSCSSRAELDRDASTFDRIAVRVESECRSILVLQEIARPRWEGLVGGKSAPLLTADLGFLALEIPPGVHRVEFRYRPAISEWWMVSLGGVVVVCLLFGAQIISRRDKMRLARQTSAPA